jgi:predicted dehydrogenase
MISIGIIGSDSTHTENYAAVLNRNLSGNGMRATRLWGADAKQARAKGAQAGIGTVTNSVEDAMEHVDAVMVLNRWGNDHFAPAMQAIEKGLPLFVDKPMCDEPSEAIDLVRAARAAQVPLMSGSAVRYAPSIMTLLEDLPRIGRPQSVIFTLPQTWRLYGVHAIEIMHAVFGTGALDVTAIRDAQTDLVTARWLNGQIGIANQIRDAWSGMLCVVVGDAGWINAEILPSDTVNGIPRMYVNLIKRFKQMLDGQPPPIASIEMIEVIRVTAAADRSASESRRVLMGEIPSL